MFKGKIKVFDSNGNLTKQYDNAWVLMGRYFALETLFPYSRSGNTWLDEIDAAATSGSYNRNVRYFEPGDSTDVGNMTGPTDGNPVSASTWQPGTIYDYDIRSSILSETYRPSVSVLRRSGRSTTIEMTFDSSELTGTKVYEVGIFIGREKSATNLLHDPDGSAWVSTDRVNGLIARIIFVKYNETTGNWEVDPIDCTSPQTVQYEFRLI